MTKLMSVLVRIFAVCLGSFMGLIIGGFFLYLIIGVTYRFLFPGPVTNGYECGRGMLVGWLAILLGVVLGAGVGGYCGYRLLDDDPA